MKFSQHIVVYAPDEQALRDLLESADSDPPPGFLGARLLRFRDQPGRYVIQVDFDSWESAQESNARPETEEWAERMRGLIDGEPKYEDLDVLMEMNA